MTTNVKSELMRALEELGRIFPEWRLGQTLANLATAAGRLESGAVWDLEDSEALMAARRLIETNSHRVGLSGQGTSETTAVGVL